MNNTEKLLRAYIEAQGFDVKEVTKSFVMKDMGRPEADAMFTSTQVVDYKVTKKKVKVFTEIER
jgi:hypothetical protein